MYGNPGQALVSRQPTRDRQVAAAKLWGPYWSFACAAAAAAPGLSGTAALARLVVAALVLHRHWLPLWAPAQSVIKDDPGFMARPAGDEPAQSSWELALSLVIMAALLSLMGGGGVVWLWLAGGLLLLDRLWLRLSGGQGPVGGLARAIARILLPGYLAWLALRGWAPLTPDMLSFSSIGQELAAGMRADGRFLLLWAAFVLVDFAMDPHAGLRADNMRRILWVAGYALAALLLAGSGSVAAAGWVVMLAAVQGPLIESLRMGRLSWFGQAVQPFGLLALSAAAAALALRGAHVAGQG